MNEAVRSWMIRCGEGSPRRVNLQLAYLKCGELAFCTLMPRWHSFARRYYDKVEPPTAWVLRHPLAADVMYFVLKPLEWLVRLLLSYLHPDATRLARRLYR